MRSCGICRRGDRDRFKFHNISILRQHLTSFTRHCAKTDHAESTHYGGALQLYHISINRHCAQCVDSLCCYLGDSTTAPAAHIWSARPPTLGQSGIRLNQHVKCHILRACVGLSDYWQQLQTIPPGLSAVCCLTGIATPRLHACMHNGLNYQGLPAVPLCISRPLIHC